MAVKKRSTKKTTTSTKRATPKKRTTTRKYSPVAQEEVAKEMRKFKKGTAVSGRSGKKVESREQAIAIGLSEARKKGAAVPKKKRASRKK